MLGLSRSVEVAFGVGSVVMFVGTLVAIPLILVRVPDDWFVRPRTVHRLPMKVARTVIGVALIALGIAMLVLPGQGVLTILVGLGILDLPFKHRMVTRLLANPKVHGAIDKLRHKAGRGSLELPVSSFHSVTA
jgi:ABC-type spermidine/putrescine transport system permease subunit II